MKKNAKTGDGRKAAVRPDAPARPGGVASGLQRGGTVPGGSPGAGMGSVGTGGGSTGRTATGNVRKRERDGET